MPTDGLETPALTTLAQWFSPAFPVGAFSFSHGLEWLIDSGSVRNGAQFRAWLEDVLLHGAGRTDLLFLAAAYRASPAELATLDAQARALVPSKERLLETAEQGASFVQTVNAVWSCALPPLCYPVAVGAAARACGLPLEPTARLFLQALVGNLASAAVRLVPLGQTEGQAIVREFAPVCDALCAEVLAGAFRDPLEAAGSSAFLADIASMNHETQYARIFRS